VICVDLRGRGESAYSKDSATYVPATYIADIRALIAELGLERYVLFGTSLGGLVTMLLAATGKEGIAGALLNDIGPDMELSGLEHIRSYVGRSQNWPTWLHAARFLAEAQGDRYPGWKIDDWLVYAKRLCKLTAQGRIVFDYDMRIAEPFKLPAPDNAFDLWPVFRALDGIPSLIVHGGISDLLSAATVERMTQALPDMASATVPNVGHAPTLDEPEAQAAIDALLKRVAAKAK